MKSHLQRILLAGITTFGFTFCYAIESPASLKIAEAGKPLADIVVDKAASPQLKKAAESLRIYLQKSTGADFSINESPKQSASIYVGMTPEIAKTNIDVSGLDHDGFILQGVDRNSYLILGGSDTGTEYGVYDFLERYVGVRWLMPTEIGEDVPLHPSLEIPASRIVENPVFLLRYFSPLQPEGQSPSDPFPRYSEWARQNRINTPAERINYHHNMRQLLPPRKFAKDHPEFYPFVDPNKIPSDFRREKADFIASVGGNRYIPQSDSDHRWNPNFSAPGIVDAAAAEIIAFFRDHPDVPTYSLGTNDSDNFDESPESLSRRSGKQNYLSREDISDDFFKWANAVVEKVLQVYPDKWFGMLAYSEMADPPSSVKIHPRIVPFLTYERLLWLDPALKDHNQEIQARWEKAAESLGWYDYIYGLTYMVPRIYPHQTKEILQWGAKHKVHYYTAELYPNWGEGPKPWIQAKLLWNPDCDVDALMNEWCERAVGSAAGPKLKQYYDIWEKFWTTDILHTAFWNKSYGQDKLLRQYLSYNDFGYLKEVPESSIKESDQLIDEVLRLAGTSLQKQRAEKLRTMWQFYKTSYYAYQGQVLAGLLDFTNPKDVIRGLENAAFLIKATRQRRAILESFQNDPLFLDVSLRVNNAAKHGGGITAGSGEVHWGFDLISKAGPLAKTNSAVAKKLEELTRDSDETVRNLAKKALPGATSPSKTNN